MNIREIVKLPALLAWLKAHPDQRYDRVVLVRDQEGTRQFYENTYLKMQQESEDHA